MSDDQVITVPPRLPFGQEEAFAYFGDPKFSGAADAHVDPHWEGANLKMITDLPCGIARVYGHHLIEAPLRDALGRAERIGWSPRVKVIGCFQPRLIRGSSTKISTHTLAIALDFDPEDNKLVECQNGNPLGLYPLGDPRRIDPGPRTMTDEVLACFKAAGWKCGAEFKYRFDPMHVQYVDGM